jgi:hypothetical protein
MRWLLAITATSIGGRDPNVPATVRSQEPGMTANEPPAQ